VRVGFESVPTLPFESLAISSASSGRNFPVESRCVSLFAGNGTEGFDEKSSAEARPGAAGDEENKVGSGSSRVFSALAAAGFIFSASSIIETS